MLILIIAVSAAILISFSCSLAEAAIYAIPWSAIEQLRDAGRKSGKLLFKMRSEVDKPIAAILTLNTVANTAGSTVAGAAFLAVYGPDRMVLFTAVFTILILVFGEIVPKTLGVAHATPVARFLARPLDAMIACLSPLLWLTGILTRLLTPGQKGPQISEDDIRAMTSLSRKAGGIQPYEENFVRNVLDLDQKRVYDIMTPRTVVFSLPDDITVGDAYRDPRIWHFSRIPVYGENNEDLVGLIERRTLGQCYAQGKLDLPLSAIMRPLHFVQETQTLDILLRELLKSRVHLFAVLDEYGGLAGVVSLEDVLEEMLGSEIVDESDNVADLRELARQRRRAISRPRPERESARTTGAK
ncbi:MAG: HlyC/CorC family transporter [Desulfovibrio sp.]|nr:HlyC/CorC family transporter [Desulfovibrio sp.]